MTNCVQNVALRQCWYLTSDDLSVCLLSDHNRTIIMIILRTRLPKPESTKNQKKILPTAPGIFQSMVRRVAGLMNSRSKHNFIVRRKHTRSLIKVVRCLSKSIWWRNKWCGAERSRGRLDARFFLNICFYVFINTEKKELLKSIKKII